MAKDDGLGTPVPQSPASEKFWQDFANSLDGPPNAGAKTIVQTEIDPETYSEFYDLVTERLFKTPAEEGTGFLGKYIERRGSVLGLGNALRKHSYFKEDIAKSHPNDPDRIE